MSGNIKKLLLLLLLVFILNACQVSTPVSEDEPVVATISTTRPGATTTRTPTPQPIIITSTPTFTPIPPTDTTIPQGYIARITDSQINFTKLNSIDSVAATIDIDEPQEYKFNCWPSPAFSPDGRFLAVSRTPKLGPFETIDLVLIDMLHLEISMTIPSLGVSFAWLPDSAHIIFTSPLTWDFTGGATDDGLWLVDVFSGQNQQIAPPFLDFPVGTIDISPDGQNLGLHKAHFEGYGPFRSMEVEGSSYLDWDGIVGAFDWSPDGQRIVYDENNYVVVPPSRLFVANLDGSQKVAIVARQDIAAVRPHWSPDGTMIAFINDLDLLAQPSQLWVVNPDGSQLRQIPLPDLSTPSGGAYWSIHSWMPDSTHLIVSGGDGLYLISLDGSPPAYLTESGCIAIQPGDWILDQLPTPAPVTPSPVLDLSDPDSIVYALAYDLAHGTMDAFSKVIQMETISYGTGFAGSRYEIDRNTFLAELSTRIPNGPGCAGYTINANRNSISLYTTDWQPLWQEPGGVTSDELNFTFHLYPAGISLSAYFFPASDMLDVIDHSTCPFFER